MVRESNQDQRPFRWHVYRYTIKEIETTPSKRYMFSSLGEHYETGPTSFGNLPSRSEGGLVSTLGTDLTKAPGKSSTEAPIFVTSVIPYFDL